MTMVTEQIAGAIPTEDLGMTLGLASLCRESSDVLGQLSLRTNDPQIRQVLELAKNTRRAIVEQIEMENEIAHITTDNDAFASPRQCYRELLTRVEVNDPSVLDEFREADRLALQALRAAFKKVHSLRLACQLSSLMANFQMSSDKLRIAQH